LEILFSFRHGLPASWRIVVTRSNLQIQHRQGIGQRAYNCRGIGMRFTIPVTKIMETTTDPETSENLKRPLKRSGDSLKVHIILALAYAIVVVTIWAMIHL
jgi:hypothetical protein